MMRTDIACIIPCCGRLDHLKATWPTVRNQFPCVVVAWTDTAVASWLKAQDIKYQGHRIASVTGEQWFNLSRARNLGAALVSLPWLAFLDCDMLLEPDFAQHLHLDNPHDFIVFDRGGCGYSGFVAVSHYAFRDVKGYNAALEGYGYEDTDLRERLKAANYGEKTVPHGLAHHMDHGNDVRTQCYQEQNMDITHRRNVDRARERRG